MDIDPGVSGERGKLLNAAGSEIREAVLLAWEKHGLSAAEIHAAVEGCAHDMAQEVLREDWERRSTAAQRRSRRRR